MSKKRKREHSHLDAASNKRPEGSANLTRDLIHAVQAEPKSSKRSRANVDTDLVQIYEDLANENEEVRLNAVQALLSNVFVKNKPDKGHQLEKVVARLIRGLCSGRKAARLGFSIALTELLSQGSGPNKEDYKDLQLSIPDLLKILDLQTRVSGHVAGQEERDHYLGRMFGAKAILESGILLRKDVNVEHWRQVLDLIFEVAKKKAWLREECGWILYCTLQSLKSQNADYIRVQEVIDRLHSNGLIQTPEGVAIWIFVIAEYPSVKLPKSIWHHRNPLDRKEGPKLAKILRESAPIGSQKRQISQKGSWKPSLHFVWSVIIAALLGKDNDGNQSSKSERHTTFADFWADAVDNGLFAATASSERKYLGFLLFQQMLQDASFTNATIFSKNIVNCLVNQLAEEERYLHLAAEKSMKVVYARIEKEPQLVAKVIDRFVRLDGQIDFDALLRTRIIEKILSHAHVNAWGEALHVLADLITRPLVLDDRAATVRRQAVVDQLISALKSRSNIETIEASFLQQILTLLATHAYFQVKSGIDESKMVPQPPVSTDSREMFRSRITSCLTRLTVKASNPGVYAYELVHNLRLREETDKEVIPLLSTSSSIHKVLQQAWQTLETVHAKEGSAGFPEKHCLGALQLLFSLTILQLYNGEGDAVSVLNELQDCYNALPTYSSQDEQKQGSENLIEILLSLVSKPSKLHRRVAQQVFSAFVANISFEGLQPIFKVLMTKESLSGQGEMFDQSDEDLSDAEVSDVEEVSRANRSSTSSLAEDDTEREISDTMSSDDSNDSNEAQSAVDELAEFDRKLALALGTRRADEDIAAGEDESTDEDMNDEQMEALDEHLEKIFRERKKATGKQQEKKAARENIVNFKSRVLELLEIFTKQRHSDLVTIQLLVPLLNVIRTTDSKQVADKTCNLVREYARICKGKSIPPLVDTNHTFATLESVHSEAMKESSNAYHTACSQASVLLTKVLAANNKENLRRIITIYGVTQERFLLDPTCKVTPSFFLDWQNHCISSRSKYV